MVAARQRRCIFVGSCDTWIQEWVTGPAGHRRSPLLISRYFVFYMFVYGRSSSLRRSDFGGAMRWSWLGREWSGGVRRPVPSHLCVFVPDDNHRDCG